MPPGVKPGFAKGVTLSVKERVLTSFCHLDIVGCLLKKKAHKGGFMGRTPTSNILGFLLKTVGINGNLTS